MTPEQIKTLRQIIDTLKLDNISFLVGKSDRGDLCFKVPKNTEEEPHFTLDSIPVNKDTNTELSKLFN